MSLGRRIREARQAADMTQEQLARAIGVTTATPSRWESDKNRPYDRLLSKIAKELGTTVESLTRDERVPTPKGAESPLESALQAWILGFLNEQKEAVLAEPARVRVPAIGSTGRPWADPSLVAESIEEAL